MSGFRLEAVDLACAAGLRTLFSGLEFAISGGAWIQLVGPNGTGKTTLLRALAGLARPASGRVIWNGSPRRIGDAQWHGQVLFQGHAAGWKEGLTAAENLQQQRRLDGARGSAGVRGSDGARHADSAGDFPSLLPALSDAGLARAARLPFERLSAGQRRRVGLARLMGDRRPLWLLDEPTTALDRDGQALFGRLLSEHLACGGLAIVATHMPLTVDVAPVELSLADFAPRTARPTPPTS